MSRARDWTHPETQEVHWFDVHGQASIRELELLSEIEDIDLDDLLDANLSSREVLFRLNKASELIPPAGLTQDKKRREHKVQEPPTCVICSAEGWKCEGRMTRHHFVPKWIMLELSEYEKWAPRSLCTVWVCAGAHRFLHMRYANGTSKSVAKYLGDEEKRMAHMLMSAFREERPRIYALIAGGDRTSYEWQLVQDYRRGIFDVDGIGREPFPRWKARINSL
jgi:hypothetical protein